MARWPRRFPSSASFWATTTVSSSRFRAWGTSWPCRCTASPRHARLVPELPLAPGQPVPGRDQWRLTRRLDPSPSSEVWLAEHPRTRETRVFKFAPDAVRLKGLKREVTVARLLRDSLGERSDFVRVLEWNFDKPPYFVESEYSGLDLARWAEAQGGLEQNPDRLRLRSSWTSPRRLRMRTRWTFCTKTSSLATSWLDLHRRHTADHDRGFRQRVAAGARAAPRARDHEPGIHAGGTVSASLTGTMTYSRPRSSPERHRRRPLMCTPSASCCISSSSAISAPLAPGWEADIADSLIREDIGGAACGDPVRRLEECRRTRRAPGPPRSAACRARRARQTPPKRLQAAEIKRAHARARRPWLALVGLAVSWRRPWRA